MAKRLVGFYYENGICAGITVDGIMDEKTKETDLIHFRRVTHARWIPSLEVNDIYRCSACECTKCIPKGITYEYCPSCGALMDEEAPTDEVSSETLYLCDPKKNAKCAKQSCYLRDGPCRCTTNEDYALCNEDAPIVVRIAP